MDSFYIYPVIFQSSPLFYYPVQKCMQRWFFVAKPQCQQNYVISSKFVWCFIYRGHERPNTVFAHLIRLSSIRIPDHGDGQVVKETFVSQLFVAFVRMLISSVVGIHFLKFNAVVLDKIHQLLLDWHSQNETWSMHTFDKFVTTRLS